MSEDYTLFFRETLKLIAKLHAQNLISDQQRQYLKRLLIEDDEFSNLLYQEYMQFGLSSVEQILLEDNSSMCSFRDLLDEPKEKRKRSQSLTLQTDCSA